MNYERVLIVGAGLIGTSIVLARRACGSIEQFDAVEPSQLHREILGNMPDSFEDVYSSVDEVSKSYDLLILAAPPKVSQSLLSWALSVARVVVDVCSVKRGICDTVQALTLSEQSRFICSHPMAGKAVGGPGSASATLFAGRPWIVITDETTEAKSDSRMLERFRTIERFVSWVEDMGAIQKYVNSADDHDDIMSYVSHGIHLTSLAAMLATDECATESGVQNPSRFAGPAFWDITRLASSPPDFWVDTLLENRASVDVYIETLIARLQEFRLALDSPQNAAMLRDLLSRSQLARKQWESFQML